MPPPPNTCQNACNVCHINGVLLPLALGPAGSRCPARLLLWNARPNRTADLTANLIVDRETAKSAMLLRESAEDRLQSSGRPLHAYRLVILGPAYTT